MHWAESDEGKAPGAGPHTSQMEACNRAISAQPAATATFIHVLWPPLESPPDPSLAHPARPRPSFRDKMK